MQISPSIKHRLEQPESVKLVESLLARKPALTRTGLVKELCRRLDLRDPSGDLQIGTTAKALRDLEAQGHWKLPAPMVRRTRTWSTAPTRLHQPVKAASRVPAQLEQVQGLQLVEVSDAPHLLVWNEMMIGEHPLHDARLVGRQFRYLIASDHGWLGGIGFGSAALYLEARDRWIGWSEAQRIAHLPRVINMTRFLIRPTVRCSNLASHVLGLCARRVAKDFERRYGLQPWLMESFVDSSAYAGTCYQATNWHKVGQTKGRGRNGARDAGKTIKDIYLYPLVDDFHQHIGVERFPLSALSPESGLDGQGWAEQEFGSCELGDERLTRRLVKIVGEQAAQPAQSYSQAARGARPAIRGYARFLNNERRPLDAKSMLEAHRTQTLRRMKPEQAVLLIQDTMKMNFSGRPACAGLGHIGTNQTGAKSAGLSLHSSLAVSAESGLPLGVVRLDGYAPESAKGKKPNRPIEEKESFRWLETYQDAASVAELLPGTQIICVADREADMFELFDFRQRQPGTKAELLIRAKHDRHLEATERTLYAELAAAPVATTVSLAVPRQREHLAKPSKPGRPGLPARKAKAEVRFKEILLSPPNTPQLRNRPPLRVWAIYLWERHPPRGAAPLRWMLLTTLQVASAKQALKLVRWYGRRWRIEEWHRVLKSGCNIEEHQNHSATALLRAITMDAVIAWRIMLLALLGREMPDLPCDVLFSPEECEVLEVLAQKKTSPLALP